MASQEEVLKAIAGERLYQDKRWGKLEDHSHKLSEWLVIMQTGMSEAFSENAFGEEYKALNEILQVVATGVACLEQYSRASWLDFRK